MTNRRDFLKSASALLAAGTLTTQDIFAQQHQASKIGIQLFSLPKLLEKDFSAAIAMLAKMGYKEVELYGPYPFSTQAAQDRWNQVTSQLGFSGSGYFGKSAKEIHTILKSHGITTPAAHTDLDTLMNGMDKLGEAAHILGHKYVVLPAIPDEKRKTLDDYKRMADTFNKIGESAKKNGVRFGYHNHGYGLSPMEGQIPLHILLEKTDPNLVFFEMDLYWTTAGGADPIALLEKYPHRYKMMHVKDMKEKKRFSGDGGDATQWIALFPFMTTAGDGVMDLKGIIKKGRAVGVEHFFVEQDMVADPEVALKRSIDFLKKV